MADEEIVDAAYALDFVEEIYTHIPNDVYMEGVHASVHEADLVECYVDHYPHEVEYDHQTSNYLETEFPRPYTLFIDGEYVEFEFIVKKYNMHIFTGYSSLYYPSGIVLTNWAGQFNTRPFFDYIGASSDFEIGLIYIYEGRLIVRKIENNWGRVYITEKTTTQWDDWQIQIFQYAGDVTLISPLGVLSQMPQLQEDDFWFPLYITSPYRWNPQQARFDYEMQYILYHELPNSSLWHLLMGVK